MNIEQLVADLNKQGVKLWVEGEQLRANAPKGVLTLETRDLLAENKAELILLLHEKNADTDINLSPIKADRPQNLPLSFAQERLWLLNQMEPDNPFYNEQTTIKLHGHLNVVALEQSLNKIIDRHEVLRTNFRTINEQPVQVIADSLILSVPVVDLTELPEDEREIACQKLAATEATQTFDLASSPLIRACVVKLKEVEHALVLTVHHIIVDGWSTGVLMRELATIYSALCNNLSPELPELPIQYADYAIWQRQWLQKEVLQTQLDYWKQLLNKAPNLLELPTDRPRPAIQTYRGAVQYVELSNELSQAIANFSRQQGATLFMTLFCAYVTLLYRYTGSDDIVVGTPTANRDRLELEGLIGFFVNTLVMRTDLSGNPSFKELLSRVRQLTLKAYAHPDLPFEELVKALRPERDLSYTPLFQVMFVFQNAPISEVELAGLTISSLPTQSAPAKFDLTLSMQNTATGLVSMWQYNADLFDASTIERMSGHFVTLLEGIVANPIQQISQLPLLTAIEQQQLLVEWNNTQSNYPQDKCIHQLFEEQVARTPDAVAVVFEYEQLTYRQLNYRANQLAHYLQSLGVKPDVLVGICVERSLEMVVGLLGILKAGGAYVPLDPDYPAERLSFMLEDAQVTVLLTQQQLKEKLPQHQAQVVYLDTDWQFIYKSCQENPITTVQDSNLAYVIYTSGSTGKPKGAMNTHLGICNRLLWMQQAYQLTVVDCILQKTPFSFDVSVWEFFWPLITGARLVVAKPGGHKDSAYLVNLILEQQVTHVHFVPSMLQVFLEEPSLENCRSLKRVICSGEALYVELQERFFARLDCELHNLYGPTEAAIDVTYWQCFPNGNLRTVPIGRPIANTQIYILDEHLQPVPVGVAGELHIAGLGLARGYLNRKELTTGKFIPNPFSNDKSERLYKTGDLVRYLDDGNIEYLGRIDNQVKIRGFRIELGEIETVLNSHPQIQQAVVIAREDIPGDKRLVAYLAATDKSLTTNQLREFLKHQLPEYMVPSAIAILESLPLTHSGKVDRRALPAPDLQSEQIGKYVAPRTPIEELLSQIWAQILKVEQVGIHDNFFTLGGHSLLATQLVSRIRNIFKVELALREFFANATVAELTQEIEQLQQQNLELSAPPILPRAENAELALSYAQQRLWFLDQFEPNSPFYNMPIALRLAGTLQIAALEQSLQEIIARHEALRTNFITIDEQPTQIIQTQTNWTVCVVELQHLPSSEQEIATQQLAQQQAIQPFELATQPLVRATLVVLSETEHVLLLCMHHIVSDGWSMGIFIQELATLYNAYLIGQPSPLASLPIQYADFALWQRQWLQGEVLQSQLSYWQQQLKDAPALLSLPTDRPRPAVQTYHGTHLEFALPPELTGKLTKLSQEQGCTLFMTLLAAFDTLLYRYTGQSDILVGSPIANRDRSEIEGLIGFFVNTLVMRSNLADNPSFSELLGRVREMTMEAYSHQHLPFEMLVEASQPERDLSYTPLFQVMFVLQNAPTSGLELTGLSVSPLPIKGITSRFDLTLIMRNNGTGLAGVWEYNTDLFDASTIERMTGHFVTLLEGIIANPQQPISQLPLLTQLEQQKLLVEWNDTGVDYPLHKCIHQLFEEQVARTPDAVAVEFENQQLTYHQLNYRANQLAHYLQSLGVKPDVLVGLCVERSLEMVIGLLGILKAGGAYVPLDPEYPQERLRFILEDAQVRVLVTPQLLKERLPQNQAKLICLDTDAEVISQCSQDNLICGVQPNNLAYIIYTSGSTGQPKGIAMSQLALCNLILWHRDNLKIAPGAKTLQFASINFDVSFQEIFTTWCSGGTLFLIAEELRRDASALLGFLQQEAIERMFLPFVGLQQLAEVAVGSELVNSHLREIITAGEQLQITPAISEWFRKLTDCTLHNQYGPSETHLATSLTLPNSVDTWPLLPAIGRPIANTQIYILDKYLQPVPVGVPGEIYIAGVLLAQGYFNRPELTQEKFIPNPFSDKPHSRLYKTGDLARYLSDGNIEFLGRIDSQVKVRGFRIELGEVEAVLSQLMDVQASCAVVREDTPGDKRLVAYIVPQNEQTCTERLALSEVERSRSTLSVSVVRNFLKSKLPEYMVPSAIVILDALPLTPNGKLDRRALPAPDVHSQLSDKYVAPRNPIEEILSVIWAQVLKIEQVGIHDNFFELGGHSLLAMQLVSRVRNSLKVELLLRSLFAAPTVAELAQVIGQLQQQDLELISPPIVPRARDTELPLSYAQQRLWFLDQLEPNSAAYNLPLPLRLVGILNRTALEQSLQEIIYRHEALRTNFVIIDGKPNQIIQTGTTWTVSVVDLKHLSPTEQEIATQELAQQQAQQPFNLTKGVLVKAILVVLNETEHVLLLCMHHIVSDGWSTGVFVQELEALYNAYSQGQPSPLTPLTVQYADFALWQRNWLQGDVLQSQLSYWQQQLKDAPALLSLPTDRPRPALQTFAGAHQEFALSGELTDRLVKLSQEQGVTLFMTLLAAYDILLYRYTGVADILVGTPIANRDRSEIEGLIGFFVNTLVMRTDLAGNPSFSELLTRVREVALGAYAHQNLPFEMLVEALQPERDLSHTPLFQVMFVLQNAPTFGLELTGLTVSSLSIKGTTSRFDLTLIMQNTATGLVGVWEYNTDLFDASTIERMTGHFVTLLEGIIANPQQPISQLPLLPEVEQRQLLIEWNDTQSNYPQNKCIHQLFEEQVERTPDAIAVVFENQQLTYYQLNCRANQLAHYLRSLGVKPDVLVGLCVERSVEMVVGLLGVLKAGGAYLPLDPEYPPERLNFMLEDAQVQVLLSQRQLIDRIPQYQAKQVFFDEVWSQIAQNNQDNPTSGVRAFHLANLIYTSGSTGRPKGVMVEHQGLCNLAQAQIQTFGLTSDSRVLQFASFSFDASISEILMALGSGGMLYLGTKDSLLPGKPLIEQLRNHCITHITLPPSALAVMPMEELPTLQTIIVAGEACPAELIKQWSIGRNFFNAYGPTEATVCATIGKATPKAIAKCTDDEKISIGKAIANTQVYILDKNLQPLPVGVPGELYIGGIGLARGYLNLPELTAERFITNPFRRSRGAGEQGSKRAEEKLQQSFSSASYDRLYKTGDLVRYLTDGNIEYLGRIDNQVKIRGFRIELGEVEAVLSQHSNVKGCCIIAREDIPGDKRLVAYLVPYQDCTLTINELRQFLKAKLPEYMVPSAFVILESLPLTPNGKVDRRALRATDLQSEQIGKYVAPRTPIEELLAQIWAQVLKLEQVGIHDNFFELGGHSLLATQLVSRIRNIFKVELALRELFANATVAELAQAIEQLQQQDLELSAPPILPRARDTELPLSYAQQRLWFLDQLEPNSAAYNLPLALRLVGNLNRVALEQSLQEIIHRHEALRTNFITVNGKPSQIIQTQTNWTVSILECEYLPLSEQEIATQQLAQQQAIQPFDLAKGALIRATLVVLSETEHALLVCMHHVVSDGWSMGVFIQELAALYNAYSQGQPSPLTPLTVQYADFALWQRNWLQGDVLQTQLSYWQQQLKDAPALLSLPTDRPRPALQTFAGAHQEFALSGELTDRLVKLSQEQGVTLFMTLLAAYDTLLYRYTGVADILVGTPIANRDRSEIEGLIGFFVNTLVMRTDLAGNPSFSELLTRVREVALGAYANQNLPFEMLVEALQPERDLSHTPLFQVMFSLQNAPMSELELADLTISSLSAQSATAKFDLTLSMQNSTAGLVGVWEYNTDLFDAGTIERMAGHFVTLLSGIVANPEERISQLPLLTATEQQQLLVEWNNTQADYPQDLCIHQLFEEQVELTPDAVAVVFGNQQLTYYELNYQANQLAHYLKSLGVGADVLVGICVERSLEMVVGLLGILKAGGAYVPLDSGYPQDRLSFMLEDAALPVLLTQQSLLELLPEHTPQVVCLDSDRQLIAQHSRENPLSGSKPENLAYVIYTSGSTGKPKGVQVNHNCVVNFLASMSCCPGLTDSDTFCAVTTISFDIAALELYLPLVVGARVVVVAREVAIDGARLLLELQHSDATVMQATPATWQMLLASGLGTQKLGMKLLCGGEALPTQLAHQLLETGSEVWNLYGPTETTIWSSIYQLRKDATQLEGRSAIASGAALRAIAPIGRPITNTQIYILDTELQPVPVGVPGELHIGGAGLAHGYLNRPKLTQEKFISNPFEDAKDSKLYKTGDLARYLPDGSIEYLGRIDNQVKIRGFRIELGEIEAALSQYSDVHVSCVIASEDTPGDKRLVAYVVPHQHCTPTINELRQFLKAKLPDYMVPNTFVILESLPLTPNGKVDRRALRVPSYNNDSQRLVVPRNQLELQLTQIWSQILKVDDVGVKDNFFDLGGHSLLVPYLMAQIKQQFGKDISIATLFQNPTIEQLATIVQTDSDSKSESLLVAIQPHGSKPPLFCLPGAGGDPFYLYNLARCLGQDQPFYSFQINGNGLSGESEPMTRFKDMAAQYIQAILIFQPQGPYFLAGHSFGGQLAFEIAQQLLHKGYKVALVAILDTTIPFYQEKPIGFNWDNSKWLAEMAKSIEAFLAKNLDISEETLQSLVWEEQLKYILQRLKMVDIFPPDTEITQLNNMVQTFKTNCLVNYAPQQVYPSRIALLRSSEASIEEPDLPADISQDSAWGWNKFSTEPVNVHFVPGNHVTMMTQPNVQVLAEKLKACIEQAQKATGDGI
ncbi:amino acid adenylation domain-containing protein [Nostoc sp. KVJ3]|uniref:non-ribosomal peptide synthase/polyketide synthase n=1 Tax=Nostoc sp. KVJ3 TaxID=457945 RepID=UPI002237DE84|nr:non-ribosomal peptide synthase/polyketide synthase [Nostoc sp. KVJ3]MCW5315485.1 amino acid adenylation domain-containing protein [Nostoc sp. KVJ3]